MSRPKHKLGPSRPRISAPGTITRYRALQDVLRLIRLLASGRWTVDEATAEMGLGRRTVYRLIEVLEAQGIRVERHREWPYTYLRIRKAQVREALGLG